MFWIHLRMCHDLSALCKAMVGMRQARVNLLSTCRPVNPVDRRSAVDSVNLSTWWLTVVDGVDVARRGCHADLLSTTVNSAVNHVT